MGGSDIKCPCCPNCVLASRQLYGKHVKLKWHLYNLDAVVSGRPPLSEEEYAVQISGEAPKANSEQIDQTIAKEEPQLADGNVKVTVEFDHNSDSWKHTFVVAKGSTILELKQSMVKPDSPPTDIVSFDLRKNYMRANNFETIDISETYKFAFVGADEGQRLLDMEREAAEQSKQQTAQFPGAQKVASVPTPMLGVPITYSPKDGDKAEGAVVWLHGFNDRAQTSANTFYPIRSHMPNLKWVHLTSPRLPITCYGYLKMEAWGDCLEGGCVRPNSPDCENQDIRGFFSSSVAGVHQCIESLNNEGIPPERIVLGGFSQGAACAAEAVLRHHKRLAGCIFVSGWLLPGSRKALLFSANRETRWLISHGTEDDQVAFACGKAAAKTLTEAGADVCFRPLEGVGHQDTKNRTDHLISFLRATFPANS